MSLSQSPFWKDLKETTTLVGGSYRWNFHAFIMKNENRKYGSKVTLVDVGSTGSDRQTGKCVRWERSCRGVLSAACGHFWVRCVLIKTKWSHKQQQGQQQRGGLIFTTREKRCTITRRREDSPILPTTGYILVSLAPWLSETPCAPLAFRGCAHVWVTARERAVHTDLKARAWPLRLQVRHIKRNAAPVARLCCKHAANVGVVRWIKRRDSFTPEGWRWKTT